MKMQLIDQMGSDLKIVNAARRSFGNTTDVLDEKAINLIKYLARGLRQSEFDALVEQLGWLDGNDPVDRKEIAKLLNQYRGTAEHWTPFAHCYATFHVEMPIFVARQLIRTTIGVTISEMSRRYVDESPDYYMPGKEGWRLAADNVKQGSSDITLHYQGAGAEVQQAVDKFCNDATDLYRRLVDEYKVAPEMARMILPQNVYTDWHWTISLVTAARVCRQRMDSHAQKEIQVLVGPLYDAMSKAFPHAWTALMTYGCGDAE